MDAFNKLRFALKQRVLKMENNELETMIKTLEAMMPGLHAPVDGKGVFIGNGMPRSKNQALRSQVLANALKELLAWRLDLGGAWKFNADKGLLEAVGEYSVDAAPKLATVPPGPHARA